MASASYRIETPRKSENIRNIVTQNICPKIRFDGIRLSLAYFFSLLFLDLWFSILLLAIVERLDGFRQAEFVLV